MFKTLCMTASFFWLCILAGARKVPFHMIPIRLVLQLVCQFKILKLPVLVLHKVYGTGVSCFGKILIDIGFIIVWLQTFFCVHTGTRCLEFLLLQELWRVGNHYMYRTWYGFTNHGRICVSVPDLEFLGLPLILYGFGSGSGSGSCHQTSVADLGCLSQILDPGTGSGFFSILDPGCTGSRIRNTAINKQKIMKNLGLYSSLTSFVIFEYWCKVATQGY
jgi:hypothetical protein